MKGNTEMYFLKKTLKTSKQKLFKLVIIRQTMTLTMLMKVNKYFTAAEVKTVYSIMANKMKLTYITGSTQLHTSLTIAFKLKVSVQYYLAPM